MALAADTTFLGAISQHLSLQVIQSFELVGLSSFIANFIFIRHISTQFKIFIFEYEIFFFGEPFLF